MIPEVFIENWRKTVPWQMTEQIQQDLMISSAWFKGTTDIVTYEMDELMATKLRALYQRRS